MYENQFIKFTNTIDPQECGMPLPVVFGGDGISFFVDANERAETLFTVVDASGVPFKNGNGEVLEGRFRNLAGNYVRNMFGVLPTYHYQQGLALFHASQSRDFVAPDECFRIRMARPIDTQRRWLESLYPYNGIESGAAAFTWLGLYGTCGEIIIPTHEVQSYSVLSGMAATSSIPKYEQHLYYTLDTGKYYVWFSNAFYEITDIARSCRLFDTNAVENVYYMSGSHNALIDADFTGNKYHILFRKARTKLYDLHIAGTISGSQSRGSTSGRILAKYLDMLPYNSTELWNYFDASASTGGFDIYGVTEADYNTLVACRIVNTVLSEYYQHNFMHEALYINSVGDRFVYAYGGVLHLSEVQYEYKYSNLLRRYENEDGGLSLLQYTCGTETFGLPFTSERPIRQWLPIMVKDPQPEQKDEIYEKLSGERVVMYATINEKYSCETDYIPYEWHKRIVMALSCDIVHVNGTRLTKSDSYEIKWDNFSKLDCGEKIVKAEWKMVANVTSRNSNN